MANSLLLLQSTSNLLRSTQEVLIGKYFALQVAQQKTCLVVIFYSHVALVGQRALWRCRLWIETLSRPPLIYCHLNGSLQGLCNRLSVCLCVIPLQQHVQSHMCKEIEGNRPEHKLTAQVKHATPDTNLCMK
jgi:hypothetical protein